jgi:hypothetical protein
MRRVLHGMPGKPPPGVQGGLLPGVLGDLECTVGPCVGVKNGLARCRSGTVHSAAAGLPPEWGGCPCLRPSKIGGTLGPKTAGQGAWAWLGKWFEERREGGL